jgi:uncharacterized membrane protein YedE/YeeE
MTFPLFPSHEVGLVFGVLSGFGFGFVLERAGFGRAQKLVGQFYGYDMSVFKVMFTAVVTAMLVVVVASGLGLADFKAIADHATSETLLVPFAVGGALVGAGFVMSGYCPGTSYVAMASGKIDGLLTVLGTIVGQVIWAELEWRPGFARFHNATNVGNFYLWELLHLPAKAGPPILAVAVVAMAAGCFIGAEKIEKLLAARADPLAIPTPGGRPRRFVVASLAAASLVGLAALALPVGTAAIPAAAPAIAQLDLARRLLDEPWKLRVVDLRPMEACAARRIPGSECVPLADLKKLQLADANAARDLVLVGEGDLAAAPLEAAAYPGKVFRLAGGFKGWEAFALTPPPPPPPGATAAELDLYRLRAGINSAMTGMKAAPPPPAPTAAPAGPRKGGGGCGG